MAGKSEKKLVKLLEELISFLTRYNSVHWAKILGGDLKSMKNLLSCEEQNDPELIAEKEAVIWNIKNHYGGMGSFNDVDLTIDDQSKKESVQWEFHRLSSELYDLIFDLRSFYYKQKKKTSA